MANGRDAREIKQIRSETLVALKVLYPAAMQADQHVFEHAFALEYARALEGPHQAQIGDFVRLAAVQQRATIANPAVRGLQISREDIERGGLAGTVRSDKAHDLAVADREIQIGKRNESAEMHRDVLDREDDVPGCTATRRHFPSPGSVLPAGIPMGLRLACVQFAIHRSTAGTIPCGRTNTITIIRAP